MWCDTRQLHVLHHISCITSHQLYYITSVFTPHQFLHHLYKFITCNIAQNIESWTQTTFGENAGMQDREDIKRRARQACTQRPGIGVARHAIVSSEFSSQRAHVACVWTRVQVCNRKLRACKCSKPAGTCAQVDERSHACEHVWTRTVSW